MMVLAGLGVAVAPDEQAAARNDAARQNEIVTVEGRLALTTVNVGRSGNSPASPV